MGEYGIEVERPLHSSETFPGVYLEGRQRSELTAQHKVHCVIHCVNHLNGDCCGMWRCRAERISFLWISGLYV